MTIICYLPEANTLLDHNLTQDPVAEDGQSVCRFRDRHRTRPLCALELCTGQAERSQMKEGRKQAVSLRVSTADLRKVKMLAQRLGARDSDVIRFAVKALLARLAQLCDQNFHGRALLPVLIEAGGDFFHHFALDTARLEKIVNDGVDKDQEVDPDDLKLLAMASMQQDYANLGIDKKVGVPPDERTDSPEDSLTLRLRGYLYTKYVANAPTSDAAND
jgi:hypothetical protein